jgi:hypothetical protein
MLRIFIEIQRETLDETVWCEFYRVASFAKANFYLQGTNKEIINAYQIAKIQFGKQLYYTAVHVFTVVPAASRSDGSQFLGL